MRLLYDNIACDTGGHTCKYGVQISRVSSSQYYGGAAARSGAVSSYSGVASPCRFRPVWQVTMSPPAIRVAAIHGEDSSAIST